MSETIIIESNRQIAYKQEKASLINVNEKDANVVLPNNKWKTRLEGGIQISVGDQIQVDSVMVNMRGSPEETIEFSGVTGTQSSSDIIDNKVLVRFQKYITNRQQFNCNLPLLGTVIQATDPQLANYGYLRFDTFADFVGNYPYRGIEGMYESAAGVYTEVAQGGVFVKPPSPLHVANPTRLFLGNDNFLGYSIITENVNNSVWNYQTTDIELEVATGFNTPAKIGESLTAQLHQRQGNPSQWTEKEVNANIVRLESTTFIISPNAGITDQSYQTAPTSTGDIFRARAENKWPAAIAGEVAEADEGNNYTEQSGRELFHRNLLCGNPDEYRGVYAWIINRLRAKSTNTIDINDLDTIGLYTGHTNINAEDVGCWGLNTVLLDQLDYQTIVGNLTYSDHSDPGGGFDSLFRGTSTIPSCDFLTIPHINHLIVTNNVYNAVNINNITIGWKENEIPVSHVDPAENGTPLTQDSTKIFNQTLYYGRANDQLSCGATGAKINLPNTNQYLNNADPTLQSYQTIDPTGINKKSLIRETGEVGYDSRNNIYVWSRYDPRFNQLSSNKTNFTFPTASKFTLTDSHGNYYSQQHSKLDDIAIIPVFYKESELPDPSLKDIPFCAFVTSARIDYNSRYPAPMTGEFFGRSPSCYDNLLAKVVSTQKTSTMPDVGKTPPVKYPVGDDATRTRTYVYMPYCMIGADNPTIKFDDTYGRFTISSLHTSVRGGNGVFQAPLGEPNPQSAAESMCANSLECAMSGTSYIGLKQNYSSIIQDVVKNPIISSQSGLSIQDIYLYTKSGLPIFDQPLDPRKPVSYEGCLFDKLGFELEQLIPYVGNRQSNFNRGSYGQYLGANETFHNKYVSMVKPLTTNAYISAADQLSMVLNAKNQNMENLGGNAPGQPIFINAVSDDLVALNLPSKLDYSYLIVYSNIVPNTQFYGGGNGQAKVPAMAYVTRNYSTGDFFFGEPSTWTYIADKDYIITEFDTNITLPNGLPAPIENNSSIIYKITKQKTLPPPLSAFEQPQKKK